MRNLLTARVVAGVSQLLVTLEGHLPVSQLGLQEGAEANGTVERKLYF